MNILLDPLPDAVEIDGVAVPIRTDFRAALRIILAFEDNSLTVIEKQAVLLDNLYPEPPANVTRALEQGVKFLDGGSAASDDDDNEPIRVYSFSQDARLIFAAFRQTHGIDLQTATLHWWAFLALFMDIGADTALSHLISLRHRVKTGKATKEERRLAQEMGESFEIADLDTLTLEEREEEAEFLRLVKGGATCDEKTQG